MTRRFAVLGVLLVFVTILCAPPAIKAKTRVVMPEELWALFDRKAYPLYPYEARRAHVEGTGLYRMYINADGSIRAVGVMKSTGNKDLDISAAAGLYRWHAIPGGPREVDMPVTFHMRH